MALENKNIFVPLVAAVVSAIGGVMGGNYFLERPDPYFGVEGHAVEARVQQLERAVDKLPPVELQLKVKTLQIELDDLERRLQALETYHKRQ